MIKLAKNIDINPNDVTLQIQQDACHSSVCNSQCKKGLMSFLFPALQAGLLNVSLHNALGQHHHLIDRDSFFDGSHQKNDTIGLNFDESHLFKLSAVLYGLPILMMLLGVIMGYWLFAHWGLKPDLGGLAGLIVGLLVSRLVITKGLNTMRPEVKFFK